MSKRYIKRQIGAYRIEIQDYQYRSRPPIAVRVTGTVDGECQNSFGEPCYFYKSEEAMSLTEGLEKAKQIVAEQQGR